MGRYKSSRRVLATPRYAHVLPGKIITCYSTHAFAYSTHHGLSAWSIMVLRSLSTARVTLIAPVLVKSAAYTLSVGQMVRTRAASSRARAANTLLG